MTLTLTTGIDADAPELHVTGDVPAALGIGSRFRIGDEMIEVRAFGHGRIYKTGVVGNLIGRDLTHWYVTRGLEHSIPASHLAGVAVDAVNDAWLSATDTTIPSPWGSGGGGGGGATITVADTDPGATGAGSFWMQSGESVTPYVVLWLRNDADDGWMLVTTLTTLSGDGDVDVYDPEFQSNLVLSASSSRLTKLINGNAGIAIDTLLHIGGNGLAVSATSPALVPISVDPSAGAGVVAPAGSLGLRTDGTLWQKTDTGNTDWALLAKLADVPDLASYTAPAAIALSSAEASSMSLTGASALLLNSSGTIQFTAAALSLNGQPFGAVPTLAEVLIAGPDAGENSAVGFNTITGNDTGGLTLANVPTDPTASIALLPDGEIDISNAAGAFVSLQTDGGVNLTSPTGSLQIDAAGNVISAWPSTDPVVGNALWSDGGIIVVSGSTAPPAPPAPPVASNTANGPEIIGNSSEGGLSEEYSRADHLHGVAPVQAAFVDPSTATPEDICNALIAAGLMAPS